MLYRDLFLCLQQTANHLAPKNPAECFLNPPCNCPHPGHEPQCEECPHLEACLSRFKLKTTGSRGKIRANS